MTIVKTYHTSSLILVLLLIIQGIGYCLSHTFGVQSYIVITYH